MNKKVYFLVGAMALTSSIPLSASEVNELQDDNGSSYVDGSEVCANLPIHFWDSTKELEVLILDQDTHVVYDVFNVTPNMPDVVFPTNAGDVELMVNEFNEDGTINSDSLSTLNLSIVDCGTQTKTEYDYISGTYVTEELPETDEYVTSATYFTTAYDGEKLTLNVLDKSKYTIEYQFVEKNSKTNAKELRINGQNEGIIKNLKSDIIQIKVTNKETEGSLYFEIELFPEQKDFIVRQVKEFGLQKIEGMSVFDAKTILWLLFLVIFYGMVNIAYKKQKRRYRKHKIREMRLKEKNENS